MSERDWSSILMGWMMMTILNGILKTRWLVLYIFLNEP